MPRYYTGDIEGNFWFAIQDSDDAKHFGGKSEMVFLEDDPTNPIEIEFAFTTKDLPDILFGLGHCEAELGDSKKSLDEFFALKKSYSVPQISEHLGTDDNTSQEMLKYYARLELGEKIRECVGRQGTCYFTCEL